MTQKQYEEILQKKNYLKAEYIDSNNRPIACLVLPCMNAGVVDPIIEFTSVKWYHWSTLVNCAGSQNLHKAVSGIKFKTDDALQSTKEVYERISKMVSN